MVSLQFQDNQTTTDRQYITQSGEDLIAVFLFIACLFGIFLLARSLITNYWINEIIQIYVLLKEKAW